MGQIPSRPDHIKIPLRHIYCRPARRGATAVAGRPAQRAGHAATAYV